MYHKEKFTYYEVSCFDVYPNNEFYALNFFIYMYHVLIKNKYLSHNDVSRAN